MFDDFNSVENVYFGVFFYTGNPHAFSVPNLLVPSFIQQMWSAYFVPDILLHFENIGVRKTNKADNLVKGD